MSAKSDHVYAIALKLAKGVGPVAYKRCIDLFGHAKDVFCTSAVSKGKKGNVKIDFVALLRQENALLATATHFLDVHARRGIDILAYGEAAYPKRLAQLDAPPSLLYCSSQIGLDLSRVVSIVGTRNSSSYGKEITKSLVQQLKPYHPLIVSGLAYGIDIVAHEEALAHNLPTVAVMPGGHDRIYPAFHASIAEKITSQGGGIVSEYSLGIQPSIHHFPARNRIIAGLADATIVVEAPKKSGALITAYHACEYNREVFAVPGSIQSKNTEGCHELIKHHVAHLITHIDDLAYVMNWSKASVKTYHDHQSHAIHLTTQEKTFMETLHTHQQPVTLEIMSSSLKLPSHAIASLALHLEMKGVIAVIGDAYQVKRQ